MVKIYPLNVMDYDWMLIVLMGFLLLVLLLVIGVLLLMLRHKQQMIARYDLLTETMYDIFWIMDVETNRFVYVSPSVERMRGYTVDEIMQQSVDAALTEEARLVVRKAIAEEKNKFVTGQKTEKDYEVHQLPQPCKDGSLVWTEVITHFFNDPVTTKVLIHGVTRDITVRHKLDEQVRFLANHDALTRLQNRHAFFETGELWFWHAKQQKTPLAYLQFDLNGFKPINDTFGHAMGDEVLKYFADLLEDTFKEPMQQNTALVARMGGDEFSVLLAQVSEEDLAEWRQKLLAKTAQPLTIKGQTLSFSTAIGQAFLDDEQTLSELAMIADQDLYRHKHYLKSQVAAE